MVRGYNLSQPLSKINRLSASFDLIWPQTVSASFWPHLPSNSLCLILGSFDLKQYVLNLPLKQYLPHFGLIWPQTVSASFDLIWPQTVSASF